MIYISITKKGNYEVGMARLTGRVQGGVAVEVNLRQVFLKSRTLKVEVNIWKVHYRTLLLAQDKS